MRLSRCLSLLFLSLCVVVAAARLVSAQSEQAPTVTSVWGCAFWGNNGTSGCKAGDLITVFGTGFQHPAGWTFAMVGGVDCLNVSVLSDSMLTGQLPNINSAGGPTALQVWANSRSPVYYLVSYEPIPSAPWIWSVRGCSVDVNNATTLCNGGRYVYAYGQQFSSESLTVQVRDEVNAHSYTATNVSWISSGIVTFQLPYIPTTSQYGDLYTVQISCNGTYSNTPALVNYTNQQPVVTAISGCASTNGTATRGCQAGMIITVTGRQFLAQPLTVLVSGYSCTPVNWLTSTMLTCTLPTLSADSLRQPQWLYVHSGGNGLRSIDSYLLSYEVQPASANVSTIASVRGCSGTPYDIYAAVDCFYNDTVWVYGTNLPTGGSVSVLISGLYALNVVSYNSSALSARLPHIVTTGGLQSVQVINSSLSSDIADLVWYSSSAPVVWVASGCAVNSDPTIANSTSGCSPGVVLTVDGAHFLPPPTYVLSLEIAGSIDGPTACSYIRSTRIRCVLPSIGSGEYNRFLWVRVNAGGYLSNSPRLVMYASSNSSASNSSSSSSSSSSTGSFVTSSSSTNSSGGNSTVALTISYVNPSCLSGGCSYGDQLLIVGTGFTYMSNATIGSVPCTSLVYQGQPGQLELICTLPVMETYGGWFSVQVRDAGRYSNMVSVYYTSQRPVVTLVRGCSPYSGNVNATMLCGSGMQITVVGTQFLYQPSVFIAGYGCTITDWNRYALYCTTPYNLPASQYGIWLPVMVRSSRLYSLEAKLLMYGPFNSSSSSSTGLPYANTSSSSTGTAQGAPSIQRVTGCAATGCSYNQTLTLQGSGFVGAVNVSLLVGGVRYYTEAVTVYSSTVLTCRLPIFNTWGGDYPLTVASSSGTSNPVYMRYASQQPVIYRATGCAQISSSPVNGTYGCWYNERVTLTGSQFLKVSSVWLNYVNITNFSQPDTATLIFSLPQPTETMWNRWLVFYVVSGPMVSDAAPLLMYGQPRASSSTSPTRPVSSSTGPSVGYPIITQLLGCPTVYSDGSMAGCSGGVAVTIQGVNFQTGTTAALEGVTSNTLLSSCRVRNQGTLMTCTLPSIPTTGATYRLYLQDPGQSGRQSNRISVSYADQTPIVYSVRGCVGVSGNGTTGCVAGTVVTVFGASFYTPVQVSVGNNVGVGPCTNVELVTVNRLHCSLPSLPDGSSKQMFVQSQGMLSRSVSLVSYGSSGGSGGGGGSPSKSKSGLTLDELVAIILVVVCVVGLLLVCQVLYCLHHFAGVRFPRLARLTGGRLFAAQPSAAAGPEAYEIGMGLMEHDHQQQSPMLRPAQSVQPPAVAPYQPAFYQSVLPMPAQQAAAAAQSPPGPFLYPRSFVPSPQYYQSVP